MQYILVHCGEPSATLNAGLVGLVDACRDEGESIKIWGARRGTEGLLSGDWAELSSIPAAALESVMRTPGSALGTSLQAWTEADASAIVKHLSDRGIDGLVCAGGNRAVANAALLAKTDKATGSALRVIGLPNTAANDVTCTDHAPGFGSAARFFALAVRDLSEDNRALPAPVLLIEAPGGKTGWVAAAAGLVHAADDDATHLIYLPEQRVDESAIFEDVRAAVEERGRAVVIACEGLVTGGGIEAATGLGVRTVRPGLLGRSCSWTVNEVDVEESYRSGRVAAETALGGGSDAMIAVRRHPGLVYRSFPHAIAFPENAGRERKVTVDWVGEPGEGATEDYLEWLRPLVGEISAVERIL